MISSQSVIDGVSFLVIKSKLVHSRMIFFDSKLTLICLLIQQQLATVSVRYTQVILLIWRVLHFEDKRLWRVRLMTQSTMLLLC